MPHFTSKHCHHDPSWTVLHHYQIQATASTAAVNRNGVTWFGARRLSPWKRLRVTNWGYRWFNRDTICPRSDVVYRLAMAGGWFSRDITSTSMSLSLLGNDWKGAIAKL